MPKEEQLKGVPPTKAADDRSLSKLAKEITRDRGADFFLVGMAELKKGDLEDALLALQKAVEEDPRDYRSFFFIGQIYEKLEEPQMALEAYERSIGIRSGYLPSREAAGLIYFRKKRFSEAEVHLREAGTLGSLSAEIYYCLGEVGQRKGSCEAARQAYEKALKIDPDFLAARNGLKALEEICRKK